jgi:hypothetical protein
MGHLFFIVTVLTISIVNAQDQTAAGNLGKADFGKAQTIRTFAAVTSNPMREVLAKDVTIAAGDNAMFTWSSDLSGSDKVGISITSLGDPNTRLTKLRIGVAFAAPGDWFIMSDMVLCSSFYYYDHGGATVPVYGPFMKLALFNDGTTPVKITQLAVYAVAR